MGLGTLTDKAIKEMLDSIKIPVENILDWVPEKKDTLAPTYGPMPKQLPIIDIQEYLKKLDEEERYLFSGGHRPSYVGDNDYKDDRWKAQQTFTHLSDKRFIPARGSYMLDVLGFTQVGTDWQVINIDMPWRHMEETQVHEIGHQASEYLTRIITKDRLNLNKPKYKK